MDDKYCDVTFVLDRSGSMYSTAKDTIEGFNSFIKSQKELNPDLKCLFTLLQFNDEFLYTYNALSVHKIKNINNKTFVPGGNTALLDAIGQGITETGKRFEDMDEKYRPSKVIFIILTDGEENASRKYSIDKISSMIKEQKEKYNWQFMFLGANQDAIAKACSLGIGASNSLTYTSNDVGTRAVYDSVSNVVKIYRSFVNSKVMNSFTDEDRKKQEEANN